MGAYETEPDSSLGRIADVARDLGSARVAQEADALAERTAEGRFFVACVGQFKRGKSTLLNAVLGDPVLPTGVVPVTAVITVVRFGHERSALVQFADGASAKIDVGQLAEYVTEERNPRNAKNVRAVEVSLPSPILRGGLCLVDTPGIGSVFETNSEATRAFVPQIDAALVVLGADPPISGDELALVDQVAKQVSNLILVLNKADRLSTPEKTQGAEFAQRVLAERLARPVGPLLEISAAEPGKRDWPRLERALQAIAGEKLVESARRRGIERLSGQLRHELQERREALQRPLDESERRLGQLRMTIAAAEQSMQDLGILLRAEEQRLSRSFEQQLNAFLATIPSLAAKLDLPALRPEALERAQKDAREQVQAWHAQMQPIAEKLYSDAMDRFVLLANDFLQRASTSAAPLETESHFRVPPRAFFTEMLALTGRSPIRWLADAARGTRGMHAEISRYYSWLLEVNASRVASDLNERVAESRKRLEQEIRARLREVTAVSQRALETARASRAAGDSAVQAELARLDSATAQLNGI